MLSRLNGLVQHAARPFKQLVVHPVPGHAPQPAAAPTTGTLPSGRPPWSSFNLSEATSGAGGTKDEDAPNGGPRHARREGPEGRGVGQCPGWSACSLSRGLQWGAMLATGFHLLHGHALLKRFRSADGREDPTPVLCLELRRFLHSSPSARNVVLNALPESGNIVNEYLSVEFAASSKAETIPIRQQEEESFGPKPQFPSLVGPNFDLPRECHIFDGRGTSEAHSVPSRQDTPDYNAPPFIDSEFQRVSDEVVTRVQADLGLELWLEGDVNGLALLEDAALRDDPKAQYNLSVALQQGEAPDWERSLHFLEKAAAQDYAAAVHNLGVFYHQGLGGLKQDLNKASVLLKKARKLEHEEAAGKAKSGEKCAKCVEYGWKEEDFKPHAKVVVDAAGVYALARAYHFGLPGIQVDKPFALFLYYTAANHGHSLAKRDYLRLYEELHGPARESCTPTFSLRHSHTMPTLFSLSEEQNQKQDFAVAKRSRSLARLDSWPSGYESESS